MSHVAWSVCVFVCLLGTQASYAKTAELTDMPSGGGGVLMCALDRGQDRQMRRCNFEEALEVSAAMYAAKGSFNSQ